MMHNFTFQTSPLLLGSYKRHLIGTSAAVIGWMAYSYLPKTAGVTYANKWFMSTLPFYREINERFEPATRALVDEVIKYFIMKSFLYTKPIHQAN